jgi:hypothetical protein
LALSYSSFKVLGAMIVGEVGVLFNSYVGGGLYGFKVCPTNMDTRDDDTLKEFLNRKFVLQRVSYLKDLV